MSRAITGNAPFFPTLAAALVLVVLHWGMAAVAFRSHRFGLLVKGRDEVLVRDGELERDSMRQTHVTEADLEEAMRGSGESPDLKEVRAAHLERNGDISIIMRKK